MKYAYLFCLLNVFLLSCSNIGAQNFVWAKEFIGFEAQSEANSITIDDSGYVYITGLFENTIDFDPGTDVYNLTSDDGSFDIFIVKLTPSGNLVWAKSFQGPGDNDKGNGIAVDTSGNVYITGSYSYTMDFDPDADIYEITAGPGGAVFAAKLNSSGTLIWAKGLYGSTYIDEGIDITVDNLGNVYTTGRFHGSEDFDPGSGTYIISSGGGSIDQDAFIWKLDSDGNFASCLQFGGTLHGVGKSIILDDNKNIYIGGDFDGETDFDPGIGSYVLIGDHDAFISKLDSAGNFIWAAQYGGASIDNVSAITLDNSGGLYSTGSFLETADFNPSPDEYTINAEGDNDVYVLKLDTSGSFIWAKSMGGEADDFGKDISIDVLGNIYITGFFQGVADFDPGTGIFSLSSSENYEVFTCRLSFEGDLAWAIQMGSEISTDKGNSIAVSEAGDIYTSGWFDIGGDFDPGASTYSFYSAGYNTVFISKLSQTLCSDLILHIDSVIDITCSLPEGYATSHALNGTAPYNYIWNTIPASYDSFAVCHEGGIYEVTVTDFAGCSKSSSVLVDASDYIDDYDLNINLILDPFRPGTTSYIFIDAYNSGCIPVSGSYKMILDELTEFTSADPLPDIISGDTLIWNFGDINLDIGHLTTAVLVTTSTSAVIGDDVCLQGIILPISDDIDSSNNDKLYCSEVLSSYDPNDKKVYPAGKCEEHYILNDQLLTYTVHFQNTGTTEALNVYILDTLNAHLDIHSVDIYGSSHEMHTEVIGDSVLKFVFNDIHLPDSATSETGSHGYVIFSVVPKPALPEGTEIKNASAIYFDYNEPVITNTVVNTITDVLPVYTVEQNFFICSGEHISVGDSIYYAAGVYTNLFQSTSGCDRQL